jgi:hypothetical protein
MKIIRKHLLMLLITAFTVCALMGAETKQMKSGQVDLEFISHLRSVGVWDACQKMKIDFDQVFAPLAARVDHPYRRYRWSVDSMGQIHALPPEEEMGWTPWERWSLKDDKLVHTEWVQFPIKTPVHRNIAPWYALPQSSDLIPRYLRDCPDIESQLRRARVDVAADWLGLDFRKTFIDSLSTEQQNLYRQFRWVVIPHVIAADGPVIYALPPMNKSNHWPWLSFYTDGVKPRIFHVHYTAPQSKATRVWVEPPGAPQRPPEIYGHTWYWYDDPEMKLPLLMKK